MKPRALDLFCCAGGAGMGLHLAGFDVVGVDIRPQPRYPFEFHQADAMALPLDGFDFVWASPPCQGYSAHVTSASSRWAGTSGKDEPRLIPAVRARLAAWGGVWAMENVVGARRDIRGVVLLCGTMFGLPIPRHRIIETSHFLFSPDHPACAGRAAAYADARRWDRRDMTVTGKGRRKGTSERWKEVMGWQPGHAATQDELREAIPPAYGRWIGEQMMPLVMRGKVGAA